MNIFTYMGFGAFLVHLVKYLTLEDGLSMPQSQAAAAASTIGFINIPGRIIIGWICSFEKVKAEMVLMVCTFGAGAVIAAVPFIGSLPGIKHRLEQRVLQFPLYISPSFDMKE